MPEKKIQALLVVTNFFDDVCNCVKFEICDRETVVKLLGEDAHKFSQVGDKLIEWQTALVPTHGRMPELSVLARYEWAGVNCVRDLTTVTEVND